MISISIIETESGKKIHWKGHNEVKIFKETIPIEISNSIDVILNYVKNYKTEDELILEEAKKLIVENKTKETKIKFPNLFSITVDKKVTDWFKPELENSFKKNDVIKYIDGKFYVSLIKDNVWSPEEYPSVWKEVI